MIDVLMYLDDDKRIIGFTMKGHAGYAEYGQDIVCSAVSTLVINTINSVEEFCEDDFMGEVVDEEQGQVEFRLKSRPVSASAQLLLNSMNLGLCAIEAEYGKKHVKVHYMKMQEV